MVRAGGSSAASLAFNIRCITLHRCCSSTKGTKWISHYCFIPLPFVLQRWMPERLGGISAWFDSPRFPRRQRSYWIGSITFHLHRGNKEPRRGRRRPCCITNTAEAATLANKQRAVASCSPHTDKIENVHAARCIRFIFVHPVWSHRVGVCNILCCRCTFLFCSWAHMPELETWRSEGDKSEVCRSQT